MHSEETKRKIRIARANQKSQIIGRYGITQDSYNEAISKGLRWCSDCKSFLSTEHFYKGDGRRKNRCISCWSNRSKEYRKTRTPEQKAVLKAQKENQRLYRSYGVTSEWYNKKLKEQEDHCALCPKIDSFGRKLGVDHNHATKKVRGILCDGCNMLVDFLETNRNKSTGFDVEFNQFNQKWIDAALEYLEKYKD